MASGSATKKTKKADFTLPAQPRKILGVRPIAIFEAVGMLVFILIVGRLLGSTHRFITVSPHPFWIPVLLISVQYGCIEGIITALLATLCLYVGNVPVQQYQETLFDYQVHLAAQPFMWLVAAFILGEIRLRVDGQNKRLGEELATLTEETTIIHRAFEQLKDTKGEQDRLLASQSRTSAAIYQTFQYLQGVSPTQILVNLDKIFATALNPKKFSVYALGANGLEVATSHGWQESDAFLRRIPPEHPLYQAIGVDHRLVAVINAEDESILKGQGMLAAPLFDRESQQLLGMVKVEEIDFMDFNRNTLDAFQALCNLVGLSYAHARRYRALERQALYSNVQDIYSPVLLAKQRPLLEELCRQANIPLTAIQLKGLISESGAGNSLTVPDERVAAQLLLSSVKPPGQVFKSSREAFDFMILLPLVDKSAATTLAGEILDAVLQEKQLNSLKFSQKIETLVEPIPVVMPTPSRL